MDIVNVLFVALFVLSVLYYPFKMKGAVHFNIFEEVGFVVFKIFNIKVYSAVLNVDNAGKFSIDDKKRKKKKINNITKEYFGCLLKKVSLKNVEVYFDCGIKDDACKSALICGYVDALANSVFAVLLSKNKQMRSIALINPLFNEERLELTSSCEASLCLFDVVLSFLCAVKNKIKK